MENSVTVTLHSISTAGVLILLGFAFRQHKVWTRIKDRLNQLWKDRCDATGDQYVPLDNGH